MVKRDTAAPSSIAPKSVCIMAAVHPSRSARAGDQGFRNSSPRPVGALADRLYEIDLSSKPPRLRLTAQWNDLKPHWLENFSKNPRVELERQSLRDLHLSLPGQSGQKVTAPSDFRWMAFP